MANYRDPALRFDDLLIPEPNTGCYLWIGVRTRNGYGNFKLNNKVVIAHRWIWQHLHGPIPQGLEIDHLCRNRACVNPAHLEAITHKENTLRGNNPHAINARKDACIHGHPFDELNTLRRKDGGRACRMCHSTRSLAKYHARRAATKP